MEGTSQVQGKRKKTRPPRGAALRSIHSHPLEVRRKAVQLYLEEGFSPELIARQMGVGKSTLSKWVKLCRDQGEAGLKSEPRGRGRPRPKVAAASFAGITQVSTLASEIGQRLVDADLEDEVSKGGQGVGIVGLERQHLRAAQASGEAGQVARVPVEALHSQKPTGRFPSKALRCMLSGDR